MAKVSVSMNVVTPTFSYKDAVVTKVHENTYDIRMSDDRIMNYVENSSSQDFSTGDYVAVLISEKSNVDKEYKIIGKGKRITEASSIPIVRV